MHPERDHPDKEQLRAFLDGRLSGVDLAGIALHIENCDSCCQNLRAIPEDSFLTQLRAAGKAGIAGASSDLSIGPAEHVLPASLRQHPRYKIGRFLGAGGMGVVYQAEHRVMDRTVAIKIIHQALIRNPRVLDRFRQEVKAAARLSHPNIVAAYDADQAGDVHFLVMEYVDGINLAALVERKGPLEITTACNFARQTAKGLQHALDASMVHRDIKPHNLMLTRKGQIKILDFGLARLASETRVDPEFTSVPMANGLTRLGEVMGTPEFMAPEQITDPHRADIRADLFSLGCTLHYMLAGQSPFAEESVLARLCQREREPVSIATMRPELPAELVAIIRKLMAQEPSQRFQTPAEVQSVLLPFAKPLVPAKPSNAPASGQVAESKPAAAPPGSTVVRGFVARCPFCSANHRIPNQALGASIACPHCSSFFTAVPVEDAGRPI